LTELTERERDILALMAEGLSNSDIAGKLFLSEGTVKNQVSVIYSKLGTSDRTQAVLLAIKNKLV
jgi:DNA-binding NarL/FixJ family response regulator